MTGTKEWYEMINEFEKAVKSSSLMNVPCDFRKETNPTNGYFYCNGEVNKVFQAYMHGYMAHRCISNLL